MTFALALTTSIHTLAIDWGRIVVGGTLTLFIAVCILLVLTILIQKPQGGGLSGAFGAGASGSGQTAFGTKTGDALTWMTIAMFVIYLGAAIGMNYSMRPPGPAAAPSVGAPAPDTGTPPTTPSAIPASGTTPPASSTIDVKPPAAPATIPPATTPPATKPADPAPVAPAPVTPAPVAPAPVAPAPGAPR